MMYRRAARGSVRKPEFSELFMFPSDVVFIFAAGPGKIHSVDVNDPHGIAVVIDHGVVPGVGPRVTAYRHLKSVNVRKGNVVVGGQVLGIGGKDKSQGASALNHLHFELWDTSRPATAGRGRDSFAIDPHVLLSQSGLRVFDQTIRVPQPPPGSQGLVASNSPDAGAPGAADEVVAHPENEGGPSEAADLPTDTGTKGLARTNLDEVESVAIALEIDLLNLSPVF